MSVAGDVLMGRFTRGSRHLLRRWLHAPLLLLSAGSAVATDIPLPLLDPDEELTEVVVTAREPRYVAPTRRDRIGRIWAPVYINEKGPFRLVLDTGSSHAAVNAYVAQALGMDLTNTKKVMLRGVTGARVVPTITV